ncbi:DUF1761 domain-containing protein [Aurantibacillus circumpalustris]|uniref:DUF1761 domain-containing protein n=1 Tax=Aurantibacillus circumpalustris TaxID=3036359 RepID=UPI00295BDF7C|nr:DUF1761 domain-containing protein [Aurantibacillus circumpalustris]
MNIVVLLGATLVPLVIGFVWYNPKIGFGKAWMVATGITEEDGKNANMGLIFGLTILLSFFVAVVMTMLVVHQVHVNALLTHQPDSGDPNSESMTLLAKFTELYGTSYRTFKHGAFHGTFAGIMLAFPIIGVPALFERKSFKYVAINAGYWVVCMALMGGIICAFTQV